MEDDSVDSPDSEEAEEDEPNRWDEIVLAEDMAVSIVGRLCRICEGLYMYMGPCVTKMHESGCLK